MHACLDVDEIVRLIACELVASEAKATAVALAGCRKNYEDLVLGALWETQGGLLPLLKSLPGDVWNGNRCTVSGPTTSFFLSPQPFDLKDFQKAPYNTGMGPFPEVRSKDAKARRDFRSEGYVPGGVLCSPVLRHQRTLVSKYEIS